MKNDNYIQGILITRQTMDGNGSKVSYSTDRIRMMKLLLINFYALLTGVN